MNSIVEIRHALDMSQSHFSTYLGVPLRTLQSWECGFRNPPEYVLSLIKRVVAHDYPELEGKLYDKE